MSQAIEDIKRRIHDVPDFPKKGIVFKDITPLLSDAKAFAEAIDRMAEPFVGKGIQVVAGIESRGFLLATPIAYRLGAGFVPIRKKGKLPRAVKSASYALEYGTDSIEAHADAFKRGSKVLLVDDVLATGGTAAAAVQLLESIGADLIGTSFLIELGFLNGRSKLPGRPSPDRRPSMIDAPARAAGRATPRRSEPSITGVWRGARRGLRPSGARAPGSGSGRRARPAR